MIRLHAVVEGQTEETFIRDVLAMELAGSGVVTTAHCITTSRKHGRVQRGGFVEYAHLRRDLELWMKQDQNPDARFTTMVDLYRMPPEFPGYDESRRIADPVARACFLEQKLFEDLPDCRFLPYLQVHEFEALLFSDPCAFELAFPEAIPQIAHLTSVATQSTSPEHIDDGPDTAPSKRILSIFPAFAKVVHGPLIASIIGLPTLRAKCAHFDRWCQGLLATAGSETTLP